MSLLVEALFGVVVVMGGVLCGFGYLAYRKRAQLGVGAFVAFAVVFGVGNVVAGVFGISLGSGNATTQSPWALVVFVFWAVGSVPWLLFAVQYTGRYTSVDRGTVVTLYAPFVALVTPLLTGSQVANILTSVVFIYCLAFVFLGAALLVQSTRSYVHLSVYQGVSLSVLPIVTMLTVNFRTMLYEVAPVAPVGLYAGAVTIGTVLFGWTLRTTPLLERTPAVETVGQRAIVEKTDDLIVIVDGEDTVVECNVTAAETLETPPVPGEPLAASLGYGTDALSTRETVTLEAGRSERRYDPAVSPITDDEGTELGTVVSLRDVTDRELREQRLAVLNRVLRHNLRNKVEVVKSHAEVVDDDHGTAIIDAADDITELGHVARTIDQFVSESDETQQVDIVELVDSVVAAIGTSDSEITTTVPEAATVRTNRSALEAALESAISNAVTYAASTVDVSVTTRDGTYVVAVSDDGPGIPEGELDAVDSGTETPLQHGTGMGLWQLKWAVTSIGGDLSFDTEEGTTVTFTVRDRADR